MNQTKIQLKIYKVRSKSVNNNKNKTSIPTRIKNKRKNIGNMATTGTKPHEGSKEPI